METFKNLFNPVVAEQIAIAIKRSYPQFDTKSFLKEMGKELDALELKARVAFLAMRLHSHLPKDPKKSIPLLVKALKQNLDDKIGINGFSIWPFTHFVSVF